MNKARQTGTGFGPLHAGSPSGGGQNSVFSGAGGVPPVPCFLAGTRILTRAGEVSVEDLRENDRVLTRDNGFQPVKWVGESLFCREILRGSSHLQPILIKAGALGNGVPATDLFVSPEHQMLLTRRSGLLEADADEALISAKSLLSVAGVCSAPRTQVRFVHLLFEGHEIVLADGAWSESYRPFCSPDGVLEPARQIVGPEALYLPRAR